LTGYDPLWLNSLAPVPPLPGRTLAEDEETVTFSDEIGRVRRAYKAGTVRGGRMSMDAYLAFPVRDRATWREYRRGYLGDPAERYPADWEAQKARLAAATRPVSLLDPIAGTIGYYSLMRSWMGTEGLSYLFYDDPALIQECAEFITEYALRLFDRAVREVRFDFYCIHEDLAGKGGPLIGPELFRRFLLPEYRRLIGFVRARGIALVLVDTDGDFRPLIPVFLEAGVNGFVPVERAAGMDPVDLRRRYGRSLAMIGGVDKRALAQGRAAIDRELDAAVRPILDQGGFIPTVDHAIPPDVSLENFRYYLARKAGLLGVRAGEGQGSCTP
jgi:uroporphyrinogen decarboxylase